MLSGKLVITLPVVFSVIVGDQISKHLVLTLGMEAVCNKAFAFGIYQGVLNGLIAGLVLLVVIYAFYIRSQNTEDCQSSDECERANTYFRGLGVSARSCKLEKDNTEAFQASEVYREQQKFTYFSLALIIGGGASNIIDRLTRGCVVDFIRVPWWPSFNLADVAITVGVVITVVSLIRNAKT